MTARLDDLLRAAGDLTRLRILNLLRQGSVCVCDLQRVLGFSQPTVSRHLAVLRHAGLVVDARRGNRMLYSRTSANSAQKKLFFDFLDQSAVHEEVMQNDLQSLESLLRQGECSVSAVADTTERIAS